MQCASVLHLVYYISHEIEEKQIEFDLNKINCRTYIHRMISCNINQSRGSLVLL